VRAAAAAVAQALQRIGRGAELATALAPAPSIEGRVRGDQTMDELMVMFASNSRAPVRSPRPEGVGGRAVFVPHPRMLAATLKYLPPQARSLPHVRYWMRRAPHAYMADAGDPLAGKAVAGVTYYQSSPTTQWVYKIQSGDTPRGRAKLITGDESRWVEMIPYNPSFGTQGTPGTLSYNFKYFNVGKDLQIPKEWNVYIPEQGVYPLVPGTILPLNPGIGGGPPATSGGTIDGGIYADTLPDGQVTAVKLQLGAWKTKEGAAATSRGIPADYPSPAMYEVNDVTDERWIAAVRAFQLWANATKGTSLRVDGTLDKATHDAINAYTAGTLGGGAYTPAPSPTTLPGGIFTIPPGVLPGGTPSAPAPPIIPSAPVVPGVPPVAMPSLPAPAPAPAPAEKKSSGGGALMGLLAIGALATQLIK
jgi:hypothetical protein